VTSSAAVRVRLRYTDLDTFIERFAPNVTRGGVFLASKSPRAEGEVFFFEVQLADGTVALSGEGKVIWVKAFNPAEPQKPHGMGVQFVQVDGASRATLDRILQVKAIVRPAAGGPARATQPHMTLEQRAAGAGAGANGRARIDTSVDLAAEYGIDDTTLRRVIDRNWTLGPRGNDDVEALLKPDPVEPASLAEALAELPRLLDSTARHRSGAQRTLETLARSAAERAAASAAAAPTNGASNGSGSPATQDPNEITAHETEPKPFD
jgi:uncharacterized protein (TIGR02266 family)